MSERKIIARFDSVIEAETVKSFLESLDIEATVETSHYGSMFSHATQSIGGISVVVKALDEERALTAIQDFSVLQESPEEELDLQEDSVAHQDQKFDQLMKRAVYAAIFGAFMLPVVPGIYALIHFSHAKKLNPLRFKERKTTVLVSMLFVIFGFLWPLYLVSGILKHSN